MERRYFLAQSKADLERCFPVMQQLRPHLTLESFLDIYRNAHSKECYELVALEEAGEILALMGYRTVHDLVRGKHIYIDDLVTTETKRGKGIGAEILKHAEGIARAENCTILRLCAALINKGGIKFYEREGWSARSFAYVKKL